MDSCCAAPATPDVLRDARFRRALWWALAINAAMFVIEAGAGLGTGSLALQADALDFLGDSASYVISLVVLGLAMRWRSAAALLKGGAMTLFGFWVVGATLWNVFHPGAPSPAVMGGVGVLALAANLAAAAILFRFREGDANMRSVWLCSRNDALGNLAVLAAASGVFVTGSPWPDLAVAAVMAGLALHSGTLVLLQGGREWRANGTGIEAPSHRH